MKLFNRKQLKLRILGVLLLSFPLKGIPVSMAQLNPLGSQYFQNQYQANPALAGMNGGLTLNGILRQQWSTIPGSPVTQAFTADYRLRDKVGLGVILFNEKAGLVQRTRMVGTYAYHLPLDEKQRLQFGVSLGFMTERIAPEQVNGDQDDQMLYRFNQRETYIDVDFGMAYTNDRLTVQAVIPNIKSFIGTEENTVADRATFCSAISYRWLFAEGLNAVTVEPKLVFRGVKGYDNLVDAGANITLINNQLAFSGMYHSSKSVTFGLGTHFKPSLSILGIYTTETAALRGYSSGNYEIGLKYNFFKNQELKK